MIRGFEDWLGQYGDAWMNGDPEAALRLFAEGAAYFETPFDPPMVGHDAIRRYWTEGARDAQRNVRFEATPIAHDGTTGFAFWRATFDRISSGTQVELEGIMSVKLDSQLRCTVFREWWHRRET